MFVNYSFSLIFLALAGCTFAYAGEYIPKSIYIIDAEGRISDLPLIRVRRGGSSSSSSAQASASASSSSSSGGGGNGGGPLYFGDYNPGIIDPGFYPGHFQNFGGGGQGGNPGGAHSFASASSSSSSGGNPGGQSGFGGNAGYNGPILFSRFGEDTGSGIKVSGSAQGEKGAFSSSSSSVDGNGKVKYSVQSGKY